jgi:hypothetical protein
MPAVALSRAGARVVARVVGAGTWQRLGALPDPHSLQGRIYALACRVAIAICAFTAAGNDRFTAVSQWIRRASQADLARLRSPSDSIAGRYRAPAATPAGLPQRARLPCPARRPAGKNAGPRPVKGTVVDGKTSRGARRADGTRVHLLGAAEHGGHLLDHLEVGVKHNETSHFTQLLEPLDLDRCCTPRSGPAPAADTGRHRRPRDLARPRRDPHPEGRPRQLLDFPGFRQAIKVTRWRQDAATRQDHPSDRLRRHQPDQRPRHRPEADIHGTRRRPRVQERPGSSPGPSASPSRNAA